MKKIKNIDTQTAKKLILENKNNPNFVIIDVRTKNEYEYSKIENAILMNLYDNDFQEKLNKLDKTKTYLIYCQTGARSSFALNIMKSMDFKEVYNLESGIISR